MAPDGETLLRSNAQCLYRFRDREKDTACRPHREEGRNGHTRTHSGGSGHHCPASYGLHRRTAHSARAYAGRQDKPVVRPCHRRKCGRGILYAQSTLEHIGTLYLPVVEQQEEPPVYAGA